jgi:carbon storage regulator
MKKVSRKTGESILIGDDIKVTIHQTKRENVIVGVDAPVDVPVQKNEIYLHNMKYQQDVNAIWNKILGDEPPIELK